MARRRSRHGTEEPNADVEAVRPDEDANNDAGLGRRMLVEAIGAGFLTLIAGGTEIAAELRPGEVDLVAKAVAPALLITAMIYAAGDVSGAHFNPVVTLAFALRRSFTWRLIPLYWLAQIAGGVLGAVTLRALFGTVAAGGANQLHVSAWRGVILEALLTMILVIVILNTATRHRVIGSDAALAVGATIALCGLFAEPLTGASMNPARSLGPVLVAGFRTHAWVYILGPFIGAIAAVIVSFGFHPGPGPEERDAAEGDAEQ